MLFTKKNTIKENKKEKNKNVEDKLKKMRRQLEDVHNRWKHQHRGKSFQKVFLLLLSS